jgi:LacI family transcriptional regulator
MQYVHSRLEKRVHGILMNSVSVLSRARQQDLAHCPVPIVLLNDAASRKAFASVYADNEAGGALAAGYLFRLGHRTIAHITGPRHYGNLSGRALGFLKVLASSPGTPQPVVLHGDNSFHGGCELTRELLKKHPQTTAIFAANDLMAFGAVRAIHEIGLRIPEDISLIGFDNLELSSVIHPPLTTIHQPKYEIGTAAVEILRRRADKRRGSGTEHRVLSVELIERRSCRYILPGSAKSE